MPDILRKYLDNRNLPLSKSVEDTLNTVLEDLAKQPENMKDGLFRPELISSCAVALNGLSRIKDPVRLFRNLGLVFEKRAECIYTRTVANAFNRLYLDAVKQKKGKEVLGVWLGFENPLTKAYASKYVPIKELKVLLSHPNHVVRGVASKVLGLRKDFSVRRAKAIFSNPKSNGLVISGVAEGLALRRDFSIRRLKAFFSHPNDRVRFGAANVLVSRKDFSVKELKGLLSHPEPSVRWKAAEALVSHNYVSAKEQGEFFSHPDEMVRSGAAAGLNPKESKSRLAHIHGKRGYRKREMKRRTRQLRL
ncbi:MAG: HEAT repeat domain-containing protein [archaeon]